MTEPAGNAGPNATFAATCTVLTCAMNSTGTVDPEGHTIKAYSWNWGDGTALSTGASPSHTYAVPGTYTITLTATDSWNRAGAPVTRDVSMSRAGRQRRGRPPPFTVTCATNTTCTTNEHRERLTRRATRPLRYLWNWGDGTPDTTGTSSNPSHVYNVAGSYTVTLTVSDAWGKAGTPVTRTATTPAEPAGNTGPTVDFPQPVCTGLACAMSTAGTTDVHGIRGYSWNFGDGRQRARRRTRRAPTRRPARTSITLVVTDNWGMTTTATRTVTVA